METSRLLGRTAQDDHLDSYTAPELDIHRLSINIIMFSQELSHDY